jgi:hypothetical protein
MSIISNIVTPIVTGVALVCFCLWVCWLIYKGIKALSPNFSLWIKYKLFGKEMSNVLVGWCMEAIEKDMNKEDVESFLLLKNVNRKRINEILYVYDQVLYELKGGVTNGEEKNRGYNRQFEIPEIS